MSIYQKYCKPSLSKALISVGLDKAFYRAEGARLYYKDEHDTEKSVVDFLGGYGAVLLGHNNPRLVEKAASLLQRSTPVHNQFSIRNGAGQLAEALNPILKKGTGWQDNFLFAFANSGAESVEVALKHAEISRGHKLEQLEQICAGQIADLKNDVRETTWEISESDLRVLKIGEGDDPLSAIERFNTRQLNRSPLFIALQYAFHGKLTSTIQLTYGEMYRKPFRRLGIDVRFMTPEQIAESYESLLDEEEAWIYTLSLDKGCVRLRREPFPLVCALLVEPVQGEGGVYCLSEEDVDILHRARNFWSCPLISDEVQSGSGRCGTFLAGEQIGLRPDYVVLSKALGGGIAKLGLVAIREGMYSKGFDIIQSSTFGEDDFSSLVALEYIDILRHNNWEILNKINEIGEFFKAKLLELKELFPDVITEIRGRGLLLGVEFVDYSSAPSHMIRTVAYQGALGYLISGHLLNEKNIRVAPPASAGNVLRLEPNIDITEGDIEQLIQALARICEALRYQDAHYLLRFLTWEQGVSEFGPTPRDYRPHYPAEKMSTSKPSMDEEAVVKAAFINHLISSDWMGQVDPSFEGVSLAHTDRMIERLSYDLRSAPFPPVRIRSNDGVAVDFILYPLAVTSSQIEKMLANNDLEDIRAAVDERIMTAKEDGCVVAGLGMFTSIVTNNGKSVNVADISVTTGNSLTVAMAAEAVREVATHKMIVTKCAAVVGAAGNIGSVYASILAETVEKILLVGSGRAGSQKRLQKTANLIYSDCWRQIVENDVSELRGIAKRLFNEQAFIKSWLDTKEYIDDPTVGQKIRERIVETCGEDIYIVVSNSSEDISEADVVLCAANSSESFVDASIIKQGALICDIAVPHNISEEAIKTREDLSIVRGGVVACPRGESLDARARAYLDKGQIYACMAETVVLAMEGEKSNFSYGNINKGQVRDILEKSYKHGFSLGTIKQNESM